MMPPIAAIVIPVAVRFTGFHPLVGPARRYPDGSFNTIEVSYGAHHMGIVESPTKEHTLTTQIE